MIECQRFSKQESSLCNGFRNNYKLKAIRNCKQICNIKQIQDRIEQNRSTLSLAIPFPSFM